MLRVPGDATAAGVAILAGIGVGAYCGPAEAVAVACHPQDPVRPDRVSAERYDALYQRCRDVLASAGARRR